MVRDVEPGEVVVLTEDGPVSRNVNILARHALCSFELIYFARPDSVIDGVSVDLFRREAVGAWPAAAVWRPISWWASRIQGSPPPRASLRPLASPTRWA